MIDSMPPRRLIPLFESIEAALNQDEDDLGDVSSYEDPTESMLVRLFGELGPYLPAICKKIAIPLDALVTSYMNQKEDVYIYKQSDRKIITIVYIPPFEELPESFRVLLGKNCFNINITLIAYNRQDRDPTIEITLERHRAHVLSSLEYTVRKDGTFVQVFPT